MQENEPPQEDDEEFYTAFSVHFTDNDNAFSTLDWLDWEWEIVTKDDGRGLSYGIPDSLMN